MNHQELVRILRNSSKPKESPPLVPTNSLELASSIASPPRTKETRLVDDVVEAWPARPSQPKLRRARRERLGIPTEYYGIQRIHMNSKQILGSPNKSIGIPRNYENYYELL